MSLNLGSVQYCSHIIAVILAVSSPAVTAWLLLAVDGQWTWIRICAVLGLHLALLMLLAVPLWHAYQTARPARHLTTAKWNTLFFQSEEVKEIRLIQVHANGGNVLHFIGKIDFLQKLISCTRSGSAFTTCVASGVAIIA